MVIAQKQMLIAYWMAPCIFVDRKTQNMFFYRNMYNFEMMIAVFKTSHKGAINLNFRVNFRKCNILQFPINGHPWDRLVYDLHEKL